MKLNLKNLLFQKNKEELNLNLNLKKEVLHLNHQLMIKLMYYLNLSKKNLKSNSQPQILRKRPKIPIRNTS